MKRRKRIDNTDISAFLDGEHRHPEQIDALIHTDTDAKKCYDEYVSLGDQVRKSEEPKVHPAFTSRVMAHIAETPPEPGRVRPVIWIPSSIVASIIVVVSVFMFISGDNQESSSLFNDFESDAAMLALGKHFANMQDLRLPDNPGYGLAGLDELVFEHETDMWTEYEEGSWEIAVLNDLLDALDKQLDTEVSLTTLTEDEQSAFVVLLNDYSERGLT